MISTIEFRRDVLKIVANARAHVRAGNKDGEESLSYVVSQLRDRFHWTLSSDIQEALRGAGFKIRAQRNGRSVRNYVSNNQET